MTRLCRSSRAICGLARAMLRCVSCAALSIVCCEQPESRAARPKRAENTADAGLFFMLTLMLLIMTSPPKIESELEK